MFSFTSPQVLHFGRGQSRQTVGLAASFGAQVLLVHGATPARADWLIKECATAGLMVKTIGCATEPDLPQIEGALAALKGFSPNVVVALGGGSVLDFGKALSALIPCDSAPIEYLEGVGGSRALDHAPIPMIALPTTAGTGAEVTKNAVIAVPEHGVKVSLRDPRMVPAIAIVDPDLMQGAPRRVALAAAIDAITQVIEPYLCTKANPMTDALCRAAIPAGLDHLRALVEQDTAEAWDKMAWVSTCGGLALANAGLGAVHGFAGVIGGKTQAPHGEVCGALLPAVLQAHARMAEPNTEVARRLAWVLAQIDSNFGGEGQGVEGLRRWSQEQGLRGLSAMGMSAGDHAAVAEASAGASSMKANPFKLSQPELIAILEAAA
ncbi:iron-containing alcohol dehydrogenase [Sulfitobacter noctilucae]|uniref:iron-containing alcohol dehydrogenase n=1 Tax=Sulfitobacter noctilucae TaxID=1342302 RepID=UPI00046A2E16|nr:iron-containing alcohol dehydrogenase [Sulfitobacter noctilucae]